MRYGEIHKLGAVDTIISDEDRQKFHDILMKPPIANKEIADKLINMTFEETKARLHAYYHAIEVQLKLVLKQAKADGIIVGRVSKAKLIKARYDTCFHEGIGAYIRRNGERVSEIVTFQ